MKNKFIALLTGVIVLSAVLTGCGSKADATTYKPSDNVTWIVTSGPGGGSDIFTRMITDVMKTEGIVADPTFVVTNKTDGGGEIGRNEVANLKGEKANNTLLTFNSGDLMPMVLNTGNRSGNFKILAIMAVDKQLIFKGLDTKYETFIEAIEAAKNGESVVIGGSKGDDIATYEALIEEVGVSKDNMKFIIHDSTGDAITAALGGHVEFVLSKPAAASQYVEAGSLIPVLALSNERYAGNLASAPTVSEIGDFKNVEIPVWRGVAAPKEMSEAAVAYWTKALEDVSNTDKWKNEYIEKNKLIPDFKNSADATTYVTQYEKDFMAANGIK